MEISAALQALWLGKDFTFFHVDLATTSDSILLFYNVHMIVSICGGILEMC